MTSLKIQSKKLSILPRFYFHDTLKQLKTNFHANFRFKRVLGFVIEYAWISKLLRDVAFTWRPRELSCRLKKWLLSGNFAILTVHVLEKVLLLNVYEFFEEQIHAFVAKLGNRWFWWFPSAMLELIQVTTSMTSPYKSLQVWVTYFFGCLVYEIFLWPNSWRGSFYM